MDDLLQLIKEHGGIYTCPRDTNGKMLGPLVGLQSRYDIKSGSLETGRLVTADFFNFAHMEQNHTRIFRMIAGLLAQRIRTQFSRQFEEDFSQVYILSVPAGGALLGSNIACNLNCKYASAEKRFFHAPRDGMKYEIVLQHHQIEPGAQVILVDDVCNNFSVIIGLLKSLIRLKLQPMAIACGVNRSTQINFQAPNFPTVPIIPLLHFPTQQFRQDDPEVSHLIAKNEVFWNPRRDWHQLLEIMNPRG